jgi:hypothetical protein
MVGLDLYILTVCFAKILKLSDVQIARVAVATTRPCLGNLLSTPPGFAQLVSQFFVDLSPVADRKDPNEAGFAIDFIDEAKPSNLVFPQAVNSRSDWGSNPYF